GIKRAKPDTIVFSYQGDGDLASIGMAEIIHAAARNENITIIFINNAIYGMTGGQMAPTTLIGQKSTTSVYGRDPKVNGYPIRVCELLSALEGTRYAERTTVHNVAGVIKTKNAIKKAFKNQVDGVGFSIVEVLSMCPTNWGTRLDNPSEATKYIDEQMIKIFPLGVYKDVK
ncbi:MAG TPA: thiamine pyrophosphate-dependent enzyme, partial [Elusimicrobiales bacterium]|nr:thiamine pyrophosphate-dependent enzyme [Elusimicrobiales bacterium]